MKHEIHRLVSLILAIGLIDIAILLVIAVVWIVVRFFVGRKERLTRLEDELAREMLYR